MTAASTYPLAVLTVHSLSTMYVMTDYLVAVPTPHEIASSWVETALTVTITVPVLSHHQEDVVIGLCRHLISQSRDFTLGYTAPQGTGQQPPRRP